MSPQFRLLVAMTCLVVSLLLYGWGIAATAIFDTDARARQAFLSSIGDTGDTVGVKAFAEAYWRRNPDVARDAMFGREGVMGIFGPREHYRRHGKGEGRQWSR